jgi:hypothetical protein
MGRLAMAEPPDKALGPSRELLAQAAREYHASRKPSKRDEPPAGEIADDARVGHVFDALWEAIRHATGALVALGAGDSDFAHASLGALVEDVKAAAATWNRVRNDQKREGRG